MDTAAHSRTTFWVGCLFAAMIFAAPLRAPAAPAAEPTATADVKDPLAGDELKYYNKEAARSGLTNLKIDTKIEVPRIIVTGFTANLGGGTVKGSGRVDLFNPFGTQTMKVEYRNVSLGAYAKSYLVPWTSTATGTIDADLDLNWRGITRGAAKRNMNGTAVVRLRNAKVEPNAVTNDIARAIQLSPTPTLRFTKGTARGTITNGSMTIDELRVSGPDAALEGSGTVQTSTGVSNTTFQLWCSSDVAAKAAAAKGGKGKAAWAGPGGAVALPVTWKITGNLESATLSVDRNP